MSRYQKLYDFLLDYANLEIELEEVLVGRQFILSQAGSSGLAQLPADLEWRPSWHKPLAGRTLAEVALWVRQWQRPAAFVGLSAINIAVNKEADLLSGEGALFKGLDASQSRFDWFKPKLTGRKMVCIGPDKPTAFAFDNTSENWHFLPTPGGAVPAAAEMLLPRADWVFISDSTIADKSLPRLLELAADAQVVLYGNSLPLLEEWRYYGVDYLAGCLIQDSATLRTQVTEAVPVKNINESLIYRVIALDSSAGCQQTGIGA